MRRNPKKVFIVHGRNVVVKDHMVAFLRVIGLSPISWGAAVRLTGGSAAYIGQALNAALDETQAVIVLLTGDDEVQITCEFMDSNDLKDRLVYKQQPRPNVLFEAGMAFTRLMDKTILVEFETLRPCAAMDGRYRIRLSNHFSHRMSFIRHLESLGCAIVLPSDEMIRKTGNFTIL